MFKKCMAVTAASVLSFPTAALAQASDFGENLGNEVESLAIALFLAVAGLVALPVLGRRDVNGGVVLTILVVMLGGFVFAQDSVKSVVTDLWKSLV